MMSERSANPPKPRLVFRVGEVGHRPNRLQDADETVLASQVRRHLTIVMDSVTAFYQANRELYNHEAPIVRMISPLAEGSDRIFARAALDLGCELAVILPFARKSYREDFLTPESKADFDALIERASEVCEFDAVYPCPENGHAANNGYAMCGDGVIYQSDLLLAIWDNQDLGKIGGTEWLLARAAVLGLPILAIDARSPHGWQWYEDERMANDESIIEVVQSRLAPPIESEAAAGLAQYYKETQPKRSLAIQWAMFQRLVADLKLLAPSTAIQDFWEASAEGWPENNPTFEKLCDSFCWADQLSILNANRYRSSFLLIYILAAFAVTMSLAGGMSNALFHMKPPEGIEFVLNSMELAAMFGILSLFRRARTRQYHERWLDYRVVAEFLRNVGFLSILCDRPIYAQIPGHLASYGMPAGTWMDWYMRSIMRSLPLSNEGLTPEYLDRALATLSKYLSSQAAWHEKTSHRCHRFGHRLHGAVPVILGCTIGACLLHFVADRFAFVHEWGPVLGFLCGFLPSLAAAIVGIVNQSEVRRVEMRSKAMGIQLRSIVKKIDYLSIQLKSAEVSGALAAQARALTEDAARLLIQEVLDWRVVFADRPIELEA